MVREKRSELSTDAQVDNVIYFRAKEAEKTIKAKEILNLKQCNTTRHCLASSKKNPYNCECFNKCDKFRSLLELFI